MQDVKVDELANEESFGLDLVIELVDSNRVVFWWDPKSSAENLYNNLIFNSKILL